MSRFALVAAVIGIFNATHSSYSAAAEDTWAFTFAFPMVWAPSISGDIDVEGTSQEIDISFSDIMDTLDGGIIGELYAEYGNWGFGFRTMYLATKSDYETEAVGVPGRPPIVARHEIEVSTELFTSDLIAAYRWTPHIAIYSGVRRTGSRAEVKFAPIEESPVYVSGKYTPVDDELYDWIVGVDLRYPISGRWNFDMQLDSGFAGDNETDRQLNALFTYKISKLHNLWFGYRYLEIGDKNTVEGSVVKSSFTQKGPTLGWAFTF